MKIVINCCWGGFGLSEEAYKELGLDWDGYGYAFDKDRANPALVACVEKLGDKANGDLSRLAVVEIPDGVHWELDNDDGQETIHEAHRRWDAEGLW